MLNKTAKQTVILQAITTLLKPLVKLLIHQNITYTGLQNILKTVYVQVADESFALANKKQTDSRISVLTGVHRADVKRIRSEDSVISAAEVKASISAQVMSIWTGDADYLDDSGLPRVIFKNASDGTPSFDELILSVSKDKHPRSFIDDWLHKGIITQESKDGKEVFRLQESGYIPSDEFEEKLFFVGKNIGDHISVVSHNLQAEGAPMFDRAIYYRQLSEQSIEQLETYARDEMLKVLVQANKMAKKLQESDAQQDETPNGRIHLGAYFYREHNSEKQE